MSETILLSADADSAGIRIDKFLSDNIDGFTRSSLSKLINDGNVKVNS